jgi:hypothetical protein
MERGMVRVKGKARAWEKERGMAWGKGKEKEKERAWVKGMALGFQSRP